MRGRSDEVSAVIKVDRKVSIWLVVDGVSNCWHIVEDNRCMQ